MNFEGKILAKRVSSFLNYKNILQKFTKNGHKLNDMDPEPPNT